MNPLELVIKTLHSFKEIELANEVLEAFGKRANLFSQYNDVAKIAFELKNFQKAIEYGEKALKLSKTKEEKYITKRNLINAYNQSNYPEKSISLINSCKSINPNDPEIILEESFAYSALGEKDKSDYLLINLLKEELPEDIKRKAYHNLSGFYFRKDDLHNGLKHFLKTGEVEAYKNQKMLPYEKWNGEIAKGRTIIIDNQCGAGDEVMHVRFMKNLTEAGMKPIWYSTRKELVELFNYNGYESVCCWDNPVFPKDSFWVYSLSLPFYLNLKSEEIGRKPYLDTLPSLDKKWEWIKEDSKFKIGLFWASSSGFEQNSFRSIELKDYMRILSSKEYSLYSLQIHSDNSESFKYPEIKNSLVIEDRSFSDTFSIIKNLDLIVTTCSFTAHAAASIGKKVCVFVPIMEYYAWTSSNKKSWWYGDNVHIFRQKKPRDWSDALNEFSKFIETL